MPLQANGLIRIGEIWVSPWSFHVKVRPTLASPRSTLRAHVVSTNGPLWPRINSLLIWFAVAKTNRLSWHPVEPLVLSWPVG